MFARRFQFKPCLDENVSICDAMAKATPVDFKRFNIGISNQYQEFVRVIIRFMKKEVFSSLTTGEDGNYDFLLRERERDFSGRPAK